MSVSLLGIRKNNFEELINSIYQTHCILQENAARAINYNLTIRNWLIGCYIIEFEQNGDDRAKYGIERLEKIAEKIKNKGVKGLHRRALNTCRIFYQTYPQIWLTLSAELQNARFLDALPVPSGKLNIWLTASAKSEDDMNLPPELLLSRLSYSHFIELIRIEDELQRLFYEVETIKNNWNIRLKIKEYDYSDAGQMNLYLNYYKDNEMSEGDPPIGIILCPDKDDTLVRYSTAGLDDHLFVSQYLVKLPEKKVFENFLKREFNK
jgi:hypothetical protein